MPKGLIYCNGCGKKLTKRMKWFQCEDCDILVCLECAKESDYECGACEPHIPQLIEYRSQDK